MFFLLLSTLLILFNIKDNIVFFLTPSEILEKKLTNDKLIRIGGMVKIKSYKFKTENNKNIFIITDYKNEITVYFIGILPDLFKEGNGVVAEGFLKDNIFEAKKVFAKHDENYMPANISEEIKKSGYWNKEYK
tara:strand:- start:1021 stop:1419 length:399 start_codon:yes stop_codon:yes gene_type:complete